MEQSIPDTVPGHLPAAEARGSWDPRGPYSLSGTLAVLQRGSADPCVQVGRYEAWLCFSTTEGPVTLLLQRKGLQAGAGGASPVFISAWGPGAGAAVAGAPRLLGAGDDWSGFDERGFSASLPPLVTEARRRHPGLRLPSTGRMFDALLIAVLEQRVTTIEARFAWRYLAMNFGERPPGPVPQGMRLPPTPAAIRAVTPWQWHAARVDAQRSSSAVRAAAVAPALERWGSRPLGGLDPRNGIGVDAALASLPGIGLWTIAETLQRTHGSPDHVSVGDYHLAAFVGQALTGRRVDDARMLELLEPWSGHRQRVVRLLGLSGVKKQAFGPRLAPMDHRHR
ncbi:DNA-3-methyladenine glycosylase family protein [Paeniglutamicibacter cryotolerans]|uniref:3-methyladenine DNA glycosylase/8-oxoguanine DNA glycosylase n=1 Tax=Paeniglutamicibacter cryotolerans TaxID=670079 RepID=A0A839QD46_9MICC|nr:3-methyladenine DNA glycosylase [Paeniglutamicibacter cryotolerans]MBB2994059.1 3-methyladenine DNA glycosylase/8-oxoguanine DNA glycosylase [Paeniglutamicibacter cryotolerans]